MSKRPWQSANLWLFLFLSSMFVVYPHLMNASTETVILDVLFSAAIFAAIFAQVNLSQRFRFAYAVIGLLAIVSTWVPWPNDWVTLITPLIYTGFFGMSVVAYCHKLFTEPDVSTDTLLGAACAYILVGILFAMLFAVIVHFDPNAFTMPDNEAELLHNLIYFSFVTYTTLGYGDILPQSRPAAMLAAYEAIVGQIFVTFVVATLVGTYVSKQDRDNA